MPLRLLIADDDSIIRQDLKETCLAAGHEVVAEASGGREALARGRALRPDLAILDIRMPDGDGLSAAAGLLQDNICPVIILTAYSDREVFEAAARQGAFAFLVKPFREGELLSAIGIAVQRHQDLQAAREALAELQGRWDARVSVERAKGYLVEKYGLTEAEAYRLIQKQSMDKAQSLRHTAEQILKEPGSGGSPRRGTPGARRPRDDGEAGAG